MRLAAVPRLLVSPFDRGICDHSTRTSAESQRLKILLSGVNRKKEKEVEAEKIIHEEKSEPSLICPPPRSRSYLPPADIQSCLESHIREIFGSSLPDNWQQTPLKENRLKYRLLAQLAAELGHAIPNSQLHLMCSAGDVLNFYSTPVKDVSKFDELCAAELPPNMKITWEK
ncbi:39S ribosomal protein L50, mitochondrial [Athene cunicularia]|uniref:39S ribosomal protein L50, mitochondrial n=1 Tax=Athene cunicularia TaxID=194338 RepID=UPI000EF71E58|nr:39S ribosomal protein L50, mitochondrial [Athene cunicularia]